MSVESIPATGTLRVGTRGSKLALAQTDLVCAALTRRFPDLRIEVTRITTKGDIVLDRPLEAIGDKGLFVTEIEQALREKRIDLAVHSAKDLPSELPGDMAIAAYPRRADPRDVLVSPFGGLSSLPSGARVGTGSLRRRCQLLAMRPDLRLLDIRGNVDTRLRKLQGGEYDALVLAAAGLARLGLEGQVSEWLGPESMLPAAGQGALAIEVRAGDCEVGALAGSLDDPSTSYAVRAERGFLAAAGAGCAAAVAAYAVVSGERITLSALIGSPGGGLVRDSREGHVGEAEEIGARLAAALLAAGGADLLAASDGEGDGE